MSSDLKVLVECDHQVTDERMYLDAADYRTIRFSYPIANNNVSVRVNGYLIDPLHKLYGFASKDAQGKSVINLYPDELSVEPKKKKLVFNRVLGLDDLIELSYTSPLGYCRKCFGTSLVYDYQVKANGSGYSEVTGISKLRQDCLKAILTSRGSNVFHSWVGTTVDALVGNKLRASDLFDIQQDIGNSLNNLKRLQINQSSYQKVSNEELLQSIDSVLVSRDEYDPTLILINVQVTSASGQEVAISQAFKSTGTISGLLNA